LTWPRPDRSEIARILDETLTALPENLRGSAVPNGGRAAAIDAVIGLTGAEIGNALAASIIKCRRIDPELVGAERKRLLAGVKGLSAIEPVRGGFDAVGGLGGLKAWAREQSLAFGSVARAAGIAPPRGILLVGPPGTGKTLLAKALAGDWQSILLKLDMGGLRSKFLGESETGLRRALSVIEAFGEKCIVLLDEIEKAIAGAGKGAGDGGVADDALGTLLSWQQDRPAGAFLVATCNSVTALPPELLRAGRFDAVFFVDLPSALERAEIVATALRAHNRDGSGIDLEAVAAATPEYSGAELAALVPAAMLRAFADSTRAVVTDDLLAAAKTIVPLAVTAARQTAELREWAKGKTRPASAPLTPSGSPAAGRTLDL
jgi:SpoVK/Ycf46/Vps4 family AAA+-type ATPase